MTASCRNRSRLQCLGRKWGTGESKGDGGGLGGLGHLAKQLGWPHWGFIGSIAFCRWAINYQQVKNLPQIPQLECFQA